MFLNFRYLEEKKTHSATVSELQTDLKGTKKKLLDLESELVNEKHKFGDELNEWRQFQVSSLCRPPSACALLLQQVVFPSFRWAHLVTEDIYHNLTNWENLRLLWLVYNCEA